MAQVIRISNARAAGLAGVIAVLGAAIPIRAVDAATPVAPAATTTRPGPQRLSDLESHIAKLHADCLKQAAPPPCSVARWWEVTAWVYENKELARADLVHLRELYLAVSRAWRGHLEGGRGTRFDRELAIKLMDRSRAWKR